MLTWARREGLLQGQRNRVIERALVRLRNLIAHPERFHRTHPVSAALPIRDAIEVINRLWGAMSDGGRLYPAPARRTVVVLARNPDGTAQWTGCPESLRERVAEEADWVTYLLRAVPSDELWDYREGFESTAHPAELLWGPGPMAKALKAWEQEGSRWEDDSTTVIDRAFFVRYPPGSDVPEPPRSRKAAEQLPTSERSGRWLVVVADHPWAAFRHGRHAVHRGELKCGWCGPCQATSFDIHRSLAAASVWMLILPGTPERGRGERPRRRPRGAQRLGPWHGARRRVADAEPSPPRD